MAERKSLLKRYGIPLNHLDFEYIKECNDAREMERIVHVLQSGEEGYFPDLTKCAEDKLRLLKPNSRLFRCEVPLLHRDDMSESDLKPIKEFSRKQHDRDQLLTALKDDGDNLPPIRSSGKISLNKGANNDSNTTVSDNKSSGKRISSTDYRKWDHYDPDEEILRMDLAEERAQEEIERKNRLNEKNKLKTPLIKEISADEERLKKLTDIERETLAEEYRLRGNEYFRAKEYKSALAEYTRSILLHPEKVAAVYNNRALTYMKFKKHADAIKDCTKCLSIEPNNIKAMYRLAQSNMECGFKEKALEMFLKVVELDPANINAKNSINTLRKLIGESSPPNATRLCIEEGPTQTKSPNEGINQPTKSSKQKKDNNTTQRQVVVKETTTETKKNDYDLASLIRPKEIVPNKWANAAANMVSKNKAHDEKNPPNLAADMKINKPFAGDGDDKEMELRLPMFNQATKAKSSKPLIEEL